MTTNLLQFPGQARTPDHISARWTFASFDAVVREKAPHLTLDIRLATYDRFRETISTAMRMAADGATVAAVEAVLDVMRTQDVWDWLTYGNDVELGKATVRKGAK